MSSHDPLEPGDAERQIAALVPRLNAVQHAILHYLGAHLPQPPPAVRPDDYGLPWHPQLALAGLGRPWTRASNTLASRGLHHLEQHQLIERTWYPGRWRTKLVWLTQLGYAVVQHLKQFPVRGTDLGSGPKAC